ncbi:MAG: hypothetical protein CVV61_04040 [Tenericutes bacterium HGW-Tenericutes-6]|jgi:type II secretory pathway pseudopilin PulG|nr:MAG: hypothetical protein CVV61_04040 [Tenericutes bacterium HGW-Tenericutes-6]
MSKKGLTLIELIGAVVIFGLMISLVTIVIQFVLRANDRVVEQSRATRIGTLLIEDIQDAFNDLNPTSYELCGESCVTLFTAYENILNPDSGRIELITYTPPLSYAISIENNILYLNGTSYNVSEFTLSEDSNIEVTYQNNQLTIAIRIILLSESQKTYTYVTQKTYTLP